MPQTKEHRCSLVCGIVYIYVRIYIKNLKMKITIAFIIHFFANTGLSGFYLLNQLTEKRACVLLMLICSCS